MRWPMGWPMVTLVPGMTESEHRSSSKNFSLFAVQLEAHIKLGRIDALRVLVKLGATGAARGRFYFRMRQQNSLGELTDFIGFIQ